MLKKYIKEAESIVEELLGIEVPKIQYELSNTKRIIGRAHKIKTNKGFIYKIELSKIELEHSPDYLIVNTLIHEIFHILSTDNSKHGGQWLKYATIFNKSSFSKKYGFIEAKRRKVILNKYKYLIKCSSKNCDFSTGYYKKSKTVKYFEKLECPKCKNYLNLYGPVINGKRKEVKRKKPSFIFKCSGCGRIRNEYSKTKFVKDYKSFACGICKNRFVKIK